LFSASKAGWWLRTAEEMA
jgi:uncharacterized protein YecE (DUF72 family)